MPDQIELSICIPTMNRGRFLAEALSSIAREVGEAERGAIEICVYDSGNDDAGEIVGRFAKKTKVKVQYLCDQARIGVDRSIIKVALMGSGKFCWLLGDDDIVEPGGISRVLGTVRAHGDAALIELNKYSYDVLLETKWSGSPPGGAGKYTLDAAFESKDGAKDFLSYFFYDLSYMSTQVVNREIYSLTLDGEKNIGEYCEDYALAYVVCRMLIAHPSAFYIAEPCVGNRTGNETALSVKSEEGKSRGIARLDRATGENFKKIADRVVLPFDAAAHGRIMGYMMQYHMRAQLMTLKASSVPFSKKLIVWRRVVSLYWRLPQFWAYCFPFIAMPQLAFFAMRKVNQSVVKRATALQK